MTTHQDKQAIFDSHLHIIDKRFPLYENQGYVPDTFSTTDYLAKMAGFDLRGGAIVSGSFQRFDQDYLIQALNDLGPDFVGVTQLPVDASDKTIIDLHSAGVRAVRFNLKRGGSEQLHNLKRMAERVYDLAVWHVELYVEAEDLTPIVPLLAQLPSVVIDHLGLSQAGLNNLYKLVEQGVNVKATGFGRLDFEPLPVLKMLYGINPQAVMFGSDLPSTRAPRAFDRNDVELIRDNFDAVAANNMLYQNGYDFYFRRNVFRCC